MFSGSDIEGCEEILSHFGERSGSSYQIGKSKVFIKEPTTLFALEQERTRVLPILVTRLKAFWKGARTRRWYKQTLAAIRIQRQWREHTRAAHALRFRSAIKIQRAVRRTIEARWRAGLKKRAASLLEGRKHRRVCSVARSFVGNYLPTITSTKQFRELMESHNEDLGQTFFFDVARKLKKRSGKLVERLVLVSNKALYVIEQVPSKHGEGFKFVVHRRWTLSEISKLLLSGRADNFVVVLMDTSAAGVKAQHDMCFEMERKTEFVAFMTTQSPNSLPVVIGDRIQFGNSLIRRFELSFKSDKRVKESTQLRWGGYRRLNVCVGDIRVSDICSNQRRGVVVGRGL
jgi:myosin-1